MYIAIWRTLGPAPKQRICSYLTKTNGDGPTLLWYILTLYHGTAAQIIRAQRKKIDKFSSIVIFYRGDIEIVCNAMHDTIQSLIAAGRSDKQMFDKMFEVLSETHVSKFNQEMQVWKSVAETISNPAKIPPLPLSCRKLASCTRSAGYIKNGRNLRRKMSKIAKKGRERET